MTPALREALEAESINLGYQRRMLLQRIESLRRVLCLDDLEYAERSKDTALVVWEDQEREGLTQW